MKKMHDTLVKRKDETTDERLNRLEVKVESIDDNVQAMREILDTWNNTKGFVTTVRVLSKVTIFIGVTGAALAGIYQALKHLGQ